MVIPVVLTDYYEKRIANAGRFSEWWPEGIQGREGCKIFHKYERETSMSSLYDNVTIKLHQGQGSYENLLDVTSQCALLCPVCFKEGLASRDAGDTV